MSNLKLGQKSCRVTDTVEMPRKDLAVEMFPGRLQVEVTTRCNMNCSMCVKYAPGSRIEEADLDLDTFRKLGPALKNCVFLVLNGVGEPLLHPDLAEMASFAREHMPEKGAIGFQTNGLLLTRKLARRLVLSGVDTFCLSVDSLDSNAAMDCELHGQASVERLECSFALLREAALETGRNIRLGVEFVLMKDTFEQLPEIVEWSVKQGAEFMVCSHVFAYDPAMQKQSLFNPNTIAATKIFNRWKNIARQQGLDIHDYLKVLWRIKKEGPVNEFLELGKRMRKQARAENVWLNLSSLLEWDREQDKEWSSRVRDIYAKARHLAERNGLDLQLPPLNAQNELRCSFMEDSVCFVTSQGDVSPCQFLWHGYTCFMDGSEKVIKPKIMGSIKDSDILEIWRSKDYSCFRSEVLEYEYPYCSSCPMVPCDDIIGRAYDFEFDCFGGTVPCGHCPWAMGGLKCLI